jgi:serine/threonine-protein kinase
MGRVFIAEHTKLGRQVALKILRTEYTGNIEAVQRFFAEARAVNRINHENIIEVSDFIENPHGPCFYVMELLKGVDLRTLQQREGALPLQRAVAIAIQVCRGLGAAHHAGIIHRDLKPDNIFLVEREGRRDFVKILDFGVAKLMNAKLDEASSYTTSAGIAVGTPEYMSPEQALGESVDHLADVYATGVIMFEMISGQRPFHANSAREVMVKHMTAQPPRVSKVRAYPYSIPPALDQLILQCLKKDPHDRPLNIGEVEDRLQRIALRLQQEAVVPLVGLGPMHPERRAWVALGAGVVLLGATVALIQRSHSSSAAASAPASEPSSAQSATGSSALVAHPPVRVTFDSDPPGATVFRERATQPVGVTPFSTTLDGSSGSEAFEFQLAGRPVVRQDLILSKDMTVKVTLPRAQQGSATPSGEPPQAQRRRTKHADPSPESKSEPGALDHGVVLDPFE